MALSDDLEKLDLSIEAITGKLVDNIRNLLDGNIEQLKNTLLVNDRILSIRVSGSLTFLKNPGSVESYLKSFQWNSIKYRSDKSLKELTDGIVQVRA